MKILFFLLLSVTAFAQDPTGTFPSVINPSQPTSSVIETVGLILLGFIGYFAARYRMKKISDLATEFRPSTWINDNWSNCVLFAVGITLIFVYGVTLTKGMAVLIGFSPNLVIDFAQKEITKK